MQAGQTKAFVLRTDEACSVSGTGSIINPAIQVKSFRVSVCRWLHGQGGRLTEGRNLTVNYLAVGKVPASAESFGGTMTLKPKTHPRGFGPKGGAAQEAQW